MRRKPKKRFYVCFKTEYRRDQINAIAEGIVYETYEAVSKEKVLRQAKERIGLPIRHSIWVIGIKSIREYKRKSKTNGKN